MQPGLEPPLLPYWLVFMLWSIGAFQSERRRMRDSRVIFFIGAATVTALMIGFRFEVGGDWGAYQRIYDNIYFLSFSTALSATDAGYAASNWLAAQLGFGVPAVNLLCAFLFMSGFARLAWKQPNPALAVLVAVPYLIIVVAMGYTRQAAAIGLICLAAADASERRVVRIFILVLIAALFHKTAVLALPIFLVPFFRRNFVAGLAGSLLFVALALLVLVGSSDKLVTNYVQGDYDSQGAAIRTLMTVVPSLMLLILNRRFDMPRFQKSYWMTCAVLSVASVPALAIASASAGIDRLSLYLVPLQVVVYSRLPYTLGRNDKALPSVLIGIIVYCFLVQFVWLNYADNSGYWLPYRLSLLVSV